MLEMHGGIKFNYDIHCEMFKILDGEIIDRDTRWVDSQLKTTNNKNEINTKIKQAMDHIREAIPELEAKNGSGLGVPTSFDYKLEYSEVQTDQR